jgi:hypothetical protein
MRSKEEVIWPWGTFFSVGVQCLRGGESIENCEGSLNLSAII